MLTYSQRSPQLSRSAAISALCVWCFIRGEASPQQLIRPENQDIALQGTIRLIHGFGPPGFGEEPKRDSHVSYWALEVPIPVNTPCAAEKAQFAKDDCQPTRRLNLFFPGLGPTKLSDLPAAKWKDHRVIVQGKIHRADTAGEMTPIFMDVSQIEGSRVAAKTH